MTLQAQSLVGLVAIPLIAWALSERRAAIGPARMARLILAGVGLQVVIAGIMLNVPAVRGAFDLAAGLVTALQAATAAGVQLVFGYLAGAPAPFQTVNPQNSFILAFHALPLILVISALTKVLYHWGILQRVVHAVGWVLRRTMGVSGPVGTSAAANIFVGMVEAPLLVRPYLAAMSRAGLFATMTVGMAGVAGTVLAIYASILQPVVPGAAGHLMVASVISVPAALLLSELMVPHDPAQEPAKEPIKHPASVSADPEAVKIIIDEPPRSSMDAIAQGTWEGVVLLANVTAMLIVAVALVALANQLLGLLTAPLGFALTFQRVLGWAFAPLAWLTGIPWGECAQAGALLGVKTVLNEFLAYLQLAGLAPGALSERSRLILAYALCGFANFGSLGIMVGGIATMAPQRRAEIASLGARTMVSGTLATLMTAAVVGAMTAG
jgi:concentrative nucleoside transporter, CNT family